MSKNRVARRVELAGRRRRFPWLLTCLSTVAVLVYLAPGIAARTPLLALALRPLQREWGVNVSLESIELGWFRPIRVTGLTVVQGGDEPDLRAAEVSTSRTPWQLFWSPDALGTIVVRSPRLHVELRADGSNVEDFVAKLFARPRDPPWKGSCEVRVVDGSLHVRDSHTGETEVFEDVDLVLIATEGTSAPIQTEFTTSRLAGGAGGSLAGKVSYSGRGDGSVQGGSAVLDIDWSCHALPLDAAAPLARRFAGGLEVGGQVSGAGRIHWKGHSPLRVEDIEATMQGRLIASDLGLHWPGLGQDRIHLERLEFTLDHAEASRGRISVRGLQLQSDMGEIELSISPQGAPQGPDGPPDLERGPLGHLLRSRIQTSGRINLAALAAQLPYSLRLREDTTIHAGEVAWNWTTTLQDDRTDWQGEIQTSQLQARRAGQTLAWEHPFSARFSAFAGEQGLVVESLSAESSFFQLTGSGTLEQFSARGRCDLSRLLQEAGRFAELEDARLEGTGELQVRWQRLNPNDLEATAEFSIDRFAFGTTESMAWQESRLVGKAQGRMRLDGAALAGVESARIDLQGERHQLRLSLAEPVPAPLGDARWEWRADLRGGLAPHGGAKWIHPEWRVDGQYQASLKCVAARGGVDIRDARIQFANLRVVGPGLDAREATADVELACRWEPRNGLVTVKSAQLEARNVKARAENVQLTHRDGILTPLLGTIHFEADLAQLSSWRLARVGQGATNVAGRMSGTLAMQGMDRRQKLHGAFDILQISVSQQPPLGPPRTLWQDPHVNGRFSAVREMNSGALYLESLSLASSVLEVVATGRVANEPDFPRVFLSGEMEYDLKPLSALLLPAWQGDLELVGRERRPFRWEGPLTARLARPGGPDDWRVSGSGEASIGWESASIFGLAVAKGGVEARLAQGAITFKPMDLAVGKGKVLLAPRVDLLPGSGALQIPSGPLVRQVALTPDVCARALTYVNPLLSAATRTEGEFSVDLRECRLPLADPGTGRVSGQLLIHSAAVRPGPMVEELVGMVAQVRALVGQGPSASQRQPLLTMENQAIDFQMENGRVYHRHLEVHVGEITIRTQGSVGLDQSLAVVAEIPIPRQWLSNRPRLAGLDNLALKIPIAGTLARPALDREALRSVLADLSGQALEGLLRGTLGRQLDRLLNPRD